MAFLIVGGTYLAEMVALTVRAAESRTSTQADQAPQVIALVALAIVIVIMSATSRSRARLGVQGSRGESMFVDLRDRLRAFGELPDLPGGWHAETAVESAYGQSFSGDFVVATRSADGRWFEVVLVDVSGKGVQAGTRSLLLSGALGGLLGEQEPNRFLTAANNYLLRQNWDEGFATAVHVSIDLATGDYTIGSAGHPPAVQFNNGSGRWEVLGEAAGPLLGVIDDATYVRSYRRLGRGDALVLYTDGVVESRFRDLTVGVDRMLGAAERLVRGGFAGGAKRLCASARAGRDRRPRRGDDLARLSVVAAGSQGMSSSWPSRPSSAFLAVLDTAVDVLGVLTAGLLVDEVARPCRGRRRPCRRARRPVPGPCP